MSGLFVVVVSIKIGHSIGSTQKVVVGTDVKNEEVFGGLRQWSERRARIDEHVRIERRRRRLFFGVNLGREMVVLAAAKLDDSGAVVDHSEVLELFECVHLELIFEAHYEAHYQQNSDKLELKFALALGFRYCY